MDGHDVTHEPFESSPLCDCRPPYPHVPFPRWSRTFDEIRLCTTYGREIVKRRCTPGQVLSEFVSVAGECWECAHPDKSPTLILPCFTQTRKSPNTSLRR